MKRILLIVFVACTLVLLFVAGRFAFFGTHMTEANYGIRAICHQSRISTLFIGSSMFRQGIDIAEVDSDAYLLSYNGNQPAFEVLQLQTIFSSGVKPQRLVVDMYPYSAASQLEMSDRKMVMDSDLSGVIRLYNCARETKGPGLLLKMLLQENNEAFVTWPITANAINQRYYRGSSTSASQGSTREKLEMREIDFDVNPHLLQVQLQGLDSIISLCREHSVDFLFVESPKYWRVHADPIYKQLMHEYIKFLQQRNVRTMLCCLTLDELGLTSSSDIAAYPFDHKDAANFIDLIHLSSQGRTTFSRLFAEQFAE